MSTAVFPVLTTKPWPFVGIAWDVTKTAAFKTDVQTTDSGREARTARWVRPKWSFTLNWNVLRDQMDLARNAAKTGRKQELEKIVNFFLARRGQYEPFFFRDPTDKRTEAQTIHPSAPAGVTDFQLVRPFGASGFVEPIGGLLTGDGTQPVVIRLNGTPTILYTANTPSDGWIRFDTAPGAGVVITGDYSYYFKLRFKKDEAGFHTFAKDFWELQKVELQSLPE